MQNFGGTNKEYYGIFESGLIVSLKVAYYSFMRVQEVYTINVQI